MINTQITVLFSTFIFVCLVVRLINVVFDSCANAMKTDAGFLSEFFVFCRLPKSNAVPS